MPYRNARDALGDRFELSGFHDTVLRSGAVPLPILETVVADWVEAERARGKAKEKATGKATESP